MEYTLLALFLDIERVMSEWVFRIASRRGLGFTVRRYERGRFPAMGAGPGP